MHSDRSGCIQSLFLPDCLTVHLEMVRMHTRTRTVRPLVPLGLTTLLGHFIAQNSATVVATRTVATNPCKTKKRPRRPRQGLKQTLSNKTLHGIWYEYSYEYSYHANL